MKHFSLKFKQQVIDDYNSGKYGGRWALADHYKLSPSTVWNWIVKDRKQGNQINDINNKRGHHKKPVTIKDYEERLEILKKYQAFLKAQRERK